MNLPLANPRARALLLLCSCAVALGLSFFAIRNAVAAHYLGLDTRDGYERAVRLEPRNPRNWYLLGRSFLYDLNEPDPARAVSALRKAVTLDPYSAEALVDLAAAYDGEGDTEQARAAYVAAQRVYPLSADVAWSYGNFLLRHGEERAGFAQLRKALEQDPKRAGEAFALAARSEPDTIMVFNQVVPPSPAAYLPVLQVLSDSDDVDTAEVAFSALVALRQKVLLRDMVPFFNALIHAGRPADAARLWPQAVSIMEDAPPPDPAGSLLWDGGFESGFAGDGFAWHFVPVRPDVQISFDRVEKHSGERSLRILFNGRENINFEDACHDFVPEPGQRYLLTAWVKTQSLTSSEGIRLEIFAFSGTGDVTLQSNELHGTQPWTQIQLPWTAPQDSGFGRVCARRNMSDRVGGDIQGAAWIDDVSLVPASAPVNGPAQP